MAKKLNSKQAPKNFTGLVFLATAVVWALMLFDMLVISKVSMPIIVLVSLGVWGVGIVIAKPGDFARRVNQVGFFNALMGKEGNAGRRGHR